MKEPLIVPNIGKHWDAYVKATYPDGMGEMQREQVKIAFFSGAFCLLCACQYLADFEEMAAAKALAVIEQEIIDTSKTTNAKLDHQKKERMRRARNQ